MPGLIQRIGVSSELLLAIKEASSNCDNLLIQILTLLTESLTSISSDLISLCESIYFNRNNVQYLN